MELRPGMYLQGDKYRIIKVLGNGGFGITYLAEHELAGRNVCIKEFFPKEYYNRTSDSHNVSLGSQGSAEMMDAYKAKFIKEAKTIARLDHPNIIHIHDVFAENNTAYYVMEYIEGESLADVVRKGGALKEEEAVEYIRIIASAIGYIHEQRIMHLDIKPANIMLRKRDNRAILIDFGLSKQYDGDGHQTSSTPVGISAGYAPMEQYQQGGVKEFSPETDIYSLGATLYTLVTGAIPPQAAIIADEGFPELPSHLSAGVRRAIETSMLIQRRRRPHSVEEFLALLDNNVAAAPIPGDDSTRIADGGATIIPNRSSAQQSVDEKTIVPPVQNKSAATNNAKPEAAQQKRGDASENKGGKRFITFFLIVALIVIIIILLLRNCSGGEGVDSSKDIIYVPTAETPVAADSVGDAVIDFPVEPTTMEANEIDQTRETPKVEESIKPTTKQSSKTEAPKQADQPASNTAIQETGSQNQLNNSSTVADKDTNTAISNKEELIASTTNRQEVYDEIFTTVDEMPTFQGGGLPEFRNWVQQNVKYPEIALEKGIQGNVVVQFVVGPDGKMSNFKVLQSPDKTLSDATIAVLQKANKLKKGWKPGKQDGKPVKVAFTMPIKFSIQQ